MTTLTDIPVSLLPTELAGAIVQCSKFGVCKLDDDAPAISSTKLFQDMASDPDYLSNLKEGAKGTSVAAAALLVFAPLILPPAALAMFIGGVVFSGNRTATLVLANLTEGDMTKFGEPYNEHGVQSGRAVYQKTDPVTGSVIVTNHDTIPGLTLPDPSLPLYGVGMYRFEKNTTVGVGGYGTGGAIAFEFSSPKVNTIMAVAWLVPQMGKPHFAVTADLSRYTSLKEFYDKTAGDRTSVSKDIIEGGPRIRAMQQYNLFPDKESESDMVITVSVSE